MMKRTRITVRHVPLKLVGDGPKMQISDDLLGAVKEGEQIVAEAMRAKFDPTTVPEDKELSALKGKVMQMSLDLAELRSIVLQHLLEK